MLIDFSLCFFFQGRSKQKGNYSLFNEFYHVCFETSCSNSINHYDNFELSAVLAVSLKIGMGGQQGGGTKSNSLRKSKHNFWSLLFDQNATNI